MSVMKRRAQFFGLLASLVPFGLGDVLEDPYSGSMFPPIILPNYWCRRGESERRRKNRRLGKGWRKRDAADSLYSRLCTPIHRK